MFIGDVIQYGSRHRRILCSTRFFPYLMLWQKGISNMCLVLHDFCYTLAPTFIRLVLHLFLWWNIYYSFCCWRIFPPPVVKSVTYFSALFRIIFILWKKWPSPCLFSPNLFFLSDLSEATESLIEAKINQNNWRQNQ